MLNNMELQDISSSSAGEITADPGNKSFRMIVPRLKTLAERRLKRVTADNYPFCDSLVSLTSRPITMVETREPDTCDIHSKIFDVHSKEHNDQNNICEEPQYAKITLEGASKKDSEFFGVVDHALYRAQVLDNFRNASGNESTSVQEVTVQSDKGNSEMELAPRTMFNNSSNFGSLDKFKSNQYSDSVYTAFSVEKIIMENLPEGDCYMEARGGPVICTDDGGESDRMCSTLEFSMLETGNVETVQNALESRIIGDITLTSNKREHVLSQGQKCDFSDTGHAYSDKAGLKNSELPQGEKSVVTFSSFSRDKIHAEHDQLQVLSQCGRSDLKQYSPPVNVVTSTNASTEEIDQSHSNLSAEQESKSNLECVKALLEDLSHQISSKYELPLNKAEFGHPQGNGEIFSNEEKMSNDSERTNSIQQSEAAESLARSNLSDTDVIEEDKDQSLKCHGTNKFETHSKTSSSTGDTDERYVDNCLSLPDFSEEQESKSRHSCVKTLFREMCNQVHLKLKVHDWTEYEPNSERQVVENFAQGTSVNWRIPGLFVSVPDNCSKEVLPVSQEEVIEFITASQLYQSQSSSQIKSQEYIPESSAESIASSKEQLCFTNLIKNSDDNARICKLNETVGLGQRESDIGVDQQLEIETSCRKRKHAPDQALLDEDVVSRKQIHRGIAEEIQIVPCPQTAEGTWNIECEPVYSCDADLYDTHGSLLCQTLEQFSQESIPCVQKVNKDSNRPEVSSQKEWCNQLKQPQEASFRWKSKALESDLHEAVLDADIRKEASLLPFQTFLQNSGVKRSGLSKRQKVKPLHPSYRMPES